jgi:predicted secreted hydrolase
MKITKAMSYYVCFTSLLCALSLVLAQGEYWSQAKRPFQFNFARDHASHPDHKIESWSYTGNLQAVDGRRFGYLLRFFRIGLVFKPDNPSRWAVRDLYITHFAVTDIDGRRFKYAERINRAGVGWAGAESARFHIWNEDWEAKLNSSTTHLLRASKGDFGINLTVEEGRLPVIHGDGGVVQKGEFALNATHYYSLTRMPTRGNLSFNGESLQVQGLSWMDHEFGTSLLEKGQRGWDWISIQLDDGTDLMIYQFRRVDGTRDVHSHGDVVYADGSSSPIKNDQFDLVAGGQWTSPASGASYPVNWRVSIPGKQIEISVRAANEDQEIRAHETMGITYWGGSIEVSGTHQGRAVRGRGHLEMIGYGDN